jgi:hypothetical protein
VPVAIGALVCVVAAAALVVTRGTSPYPDEWDPRIEPLARFVETERGLTFKHPIHVDFFERDAFETQSAADVEDTPDGRADADRSTGMFRAFGLVQGDVDLFDAGTQLRSEGVSGLYSSDTKRIRVNGTEWDEMTRLIVVHELTHALQDQHFDLNRLRATLPGTQADNLTAMVEGDASWVERRYQESLSAEEQAHLAADPDAEAPDLPEVPSVLSSLFGAPYALGEPFVGLLHELDGPTAINDAIKSPPTSDEQLLDPFRYFDHDMPVELTIPDPAKNEEEFDRGTLGALFWYLVFAERIGPKDALAAADGWGGDAYSAFVRDDKVCVRALWHPDTPTDREEFIGAFTAWASAMPAGSVTYNLADDINMQACDPGPTATIPPPVEPDVDPLVLPASRSFIALAVVREGGKAEMARCVADRLVRALTPAQLAAEGEVLDPAVQAQVELAATACR